MDRLTSGTLTGASALLSERVRGAVMREMNQRTRTPLLSYIARGSWRNEKWSDWTSGGIDMSDGGSRSGLSHGRGQNRRLHPQAMTDRRGRV